MNKLQESVLNKVSENNNEYRVELRNLNNKIDSKATSIIGDVVTLSNYTLDFSSAISSVKETLVAPILKVVESYVIKDLRSVESVNEQFIDKINDKIENTVINSQEERNRFIENLDALLNNKYLQIVKIKRVDFINNEGRNDDVERIISNYITSIKEMGTFNNDALDKMFEAFKNDIYMLISDSLTKISNLYLNNFVNEVSDALNVSIDYNNEMEALNNVNNQENSVMYDNTPLSSNEANINVFENQIPNIPEMPVMPEIPNIPNIPDIPDIPSIPDVREEGFSMPEMEDASVKTNVEPTLSNSFVEPMETEVVAPVEVKEEKKEEIEKPKHSYDVEEILKIAKSPVVTMNTIKEEKVNIEKKPSLLSSMEEDFNEREVVEEMIRRLSNRLKEIDERQAKLDEEKENIKSDEKFVNDLIKNAEAKKEELDEFEKSLNAKEEELKDKEQELDKKIKNVMPFANAVLNTDKGAN